MSFSILIFSGHMHSSGFLLGRMVKLGFPTDSVVVKNLLANAGNARDAVSIPVSERSLGVRNGNLLQYSWVVNPRD